MRLTAPTQNQVANQIVNYIRLTTIGYGAVATPVGRAGYPEAAVVAISETGKTDCAAKVAVYHNRLVYASAAGTVVSYPTRQEDAGRVVTSLLSMERD